MVKPKLTSARKAILEFLEESAQHKTAAQIHEGLVERLPSLNLSTVYRSLDYLVGQRMVSTADVGIGSPVYERITDRPHHHLVCLNCAYIFELEHELVEPLFNQIGEGKNFHVRTNHLVLYGICEDCQDKD